MLRKPKARQFHAKIRLSRLRSKIWGLIKRRAEKKIPERMKPFVHVEPTQYRLLQGARDALSIRAPRLWLPKVISESSQARKWAFTRQKVSPSRYGRIAKRAAKSQDWVTADLEFVREKWLIPKSPFFLLNLPEEKIEIIRRLNRHGIVAEGILEHGKMSSNLYLAANLGPSVDALVKKPFRRTMPLMLRVARTLGRMHALKVVHGHSHLGNFVAMHNGNIGVIDFKFAKQDEVNWHSADSATAAFMGDLYGIFLFSSGSHIKLNPKQRRELINAVIEQYPVSKDVRKKIQEFFFHLLNC